MNRNVSMAFGSANQESSKTTVINYGGTVGPQGPAGETGPQGPAGAVFTPAVSADGVLSWTNDGGLENPEPVDITGPAGETGPQGPTGAVFTPTVSADGILSWTNDGGLENPEPVNIKGPKGDKGDPGSGGGSGEIFTAKAILPASGWIEAVQDYTWRWHQTITVNGILESDEPFIDLYLVGLTEEEEDAIAEGWAYIVKIITADNAITAYVCDLPEVDIPIKIKEVR